VVQYKSRSGRLSIVNDGSIEKDYETRFELLEADILGLYGTGHALLDLGL